MTASILRPARIERGHTSGLFDTGVVPRLVPCGYYAPPRAAVPPLLPAAAAAHDVTNYGPWDGGTVGVEGLTLEKFSTSRARYGCARKNSYVLLCCSLVGSWDCGEAIVAMRRKDAANVGRQCRCQRRWPDAANNLATRARAEDVYDCVNKGTCCTRCGSV